MANFREHPFYLFPDFRKLFIGRLISAAGDKFYTIAIAWYVISSTSAHSKFELGMLMSFNVLPVVLSGPFWGTVVDRLDRRKCMIASSIIRGAVIFTVFFLMYHDSLNINLLYALTFLNASFVPLFESSVSSSLILVTDEKHLPKAVAADAMVIQFSNVLGAILGGVLIASIGIKGAILANSASFYIAIIFILFIKTKLSVVFEKKSFFKDIKTGLGFITGNKPIYSLIICFAVFNFFGAPLVLYVPMIVQFILKETVKWVAYEELFMGLGSLITAFILSMKINPKRVYSSIFWGILILGFMNYSIGSTADKYLMLFLFTLVGSSFIVVNANALSLFQSEVPNEIKGRFFAALSAVCYAVIPLAFIVNGILTDTYPISFILKLNGIGAVILAFIIRLIPRTERYKSLIKSR